jgi:hypothetical protein
VDRGGGRRVPESVLVCALYLDIIIYKILRSSQRPCINTAGAQGCRARGSGVVAQFTRHVGWQGGGGGERGTIMSHSGIVKVNCIHFVAQRCILIETSFMRGLAVSGTCHASHDRGITSIVADS